MSVSLQIVPNLTELSIPQSYDPLSSEQMQLIEDCTQIFKNSLTQILSNQNQAQKLEQLWDLETQTQHLNQSKNQVYSYVQAQFTQAQDDFSNKVQCPQCSKFSNQKHSMRKKIFVTLLGKSQIYRAYHRCSSCSFAFCPLDKKLQLHSSSFQHDTRKLILSLCSELNYELVSSLFQELLCLDITNERCHAIVSQVTQDLKSEDCLPSQEQIQNILKAYQNQLNGEKPKLVLMADGCMECCRPTVKKKRSRRATSKGKRKRKKPMEQNRAYWKEVKGFRLLLNIPHEKPVTVAYWFQQSDHHEFKSALQTLRSRLAMDEIQIYGVSDGAIWLNDRIAEVFPEAQAVLDYYHLKENTMRYCQVRHAYDDNSAGILCEGYMVRIREGDVTGVIWGLQRTNFETQEEEKARDKFITYLKNHEKMFDYPQFLRNGLPIGSGAMESANKNVCHKRLKLCGCSWYVENMNKMLILRCAKFNNRLNEIYSLHLQRSAA